jgi:hypothetical protein
MAKKCLALLVVVVFVFSCAPAAFSFSNEEYAEYQAQMDEFSEQMQSSRNDFKQEMRDLRVDYGKKFQQLDSDDTKGRRQLQAQKRQDRKEIIERYRAEQDGIKEKVMKAKAEMSATRGKRAKAGDKDWKQLKAAAMMKGAGKTGDQCK